MQSTLTASSRVIIVTHELYYGAPQALRDYLITHVKDLAYLSHPIRSENPTSKREIYKNGKLLQSFLFARPSGSAWWFVVDFFMTTAWVIRFCGTYDVYIGVNPLNCLSGLVFRSLGLVKCVIFYSIDFTPKRFPQEILNGLYHAIESFCVRFTDVRWDISPRIAQGRQKFLGLRQTDYPVAVVPVGLWEKDIASPHTNFEPHRIAFIGHLLKKQGIDKVLLAVSLVKKKVKNISFLIIGGGEEESRLRILADKLHLGNNVEFTGWRWDQKKIRKLLLGCAFGVATYDPRGAKDDNFTYFADPTKLKTYLSCGLPVIMTDVSYNAKTLQKDGCAQVVSYNASAIARAMMIWIDDATRLEKARKSAITTAHGLIWDNIFGKATGLGI